MTAELEPGEPIFEIVDGVYYVAIWHVEGKDKDWLALLQRRPDSGELHLGYRFRYYASADDAWDERDIKNVYRATFDHKTEDEAIAIVDTMIRDTLVKTGFCGTRLPWKTRGKVHKRVIKALGPEPAFKALMSMPNMNVRKLTPAEEEAADRRKDRGN